MAALSLYPMETFTPYRFRILTRGDRGELMPGAYTVARAASQVEAFADLTRQLSPWESAAPLHGPSVCVRWFQ